MKWNLEKRKRETDREVYDNEKGMGIIEVYKEWNYLAEVPKEIEPRNGITS